MSNTIYPNTSPYYLSSVTSGNYLDVMINRRIPMLASDLYWTITPPYEYRPDLLAYDLYKDSRLWWVFAQRNPYTLKDPLFDFIPGVKIYIPKVDIIKDVLGL